MLAPVGAVPRVAAVAVAGYLLGSVPVADLVSGDVDLRAVGDRNPGWWNARDALGQRAARPVLVGDIAKGAAGAAIGRILARPGEWWLPVVGGGAAMVGHAWPLFAGFRGGRSVATFGGAAAVISPATAVVAIAAGAIAGRLSGSTARGIRTGFVAYPVVELAVDGPRRTAATGLLMSFIGLRFWMASRAREDERSTARRRRCVLQPADDRLQLGVVVAGVDVAHLTCQRAEERRRLAVQLRPRRQLDDHLSPIGRVPHPADPAALLEPVDQTGDRARRQPEMTRQFTGGDRPGPVEEVDALEVGAVDPEPIGDRLGVHR